jgi:hypothetical protein
MALSRVFNLGGTKSIEIRGEAFNAFNWFEWGNPNTNFSAATFGQITSVVPNSARIIQLATKFNF